MSSPLYEHLQQRAAQTQRLVEEETLEALATAVPPVPLLPTDLEEAMNSLNALDDAALAEAAQSRLAISVSAELQSLHRKRQREGLSGMESAKLAKLVRQYEQHMLVRAQAAALLKACGRDLRGPLKS